MIVDKQTKAALLKAIEDQENKLKPQLPAEALEALGAFKKAFKEAGFTAHQPDSQHIDVLRACRMMMIEEDLQDRYPRTWAGLNAALGDD